MECAYCGQPGAWVSTEVDDSNINTAGSWVHPHCAALQSKDYVFYGDRLGTTGNYPFSRIKRITVSSLRRGSRVVYHLGARKRRALLF